MAHEYLYMYIYLYMYDWIHLILKLHTYLSLIHIYEYQNCSYFGWFGDRFQETIRFWHIWVWSQSMGQLLTSQRKGPQRVLHKCVSLNCPLEIAMRWGIDWTNLWRHWFGWAMFCVLCPQWHLQQTWAILWSGKISKIGSRPNLSTGFQFMFTMFTKQNVYTGHLWPRQV